MKLVQKSNGVVELQCNNGREVSNILLRMGLRTGPVIMLNDHTLAFKGGVLEKMESQCDVPGPAKFENYFIEFLISVSLNEDSKVPGYFFDNSRSLAGSNLSDEEVHFVGLCLSFVLQCEDWLIGYYSDRVSDKFWYRMNRGLLQAECESGFQATVLSDFFEMLRGLKYKLNELSTRKNDVTVLEYAVDCKAPPKNVRSQKLLRNEKCRRLISESVQKHGLIIQ